MTVGTRPSDTASVDRRVLPDVPTPPIVPVIPSTPAAAPTAQPAIVVPANTLYVCVVDADGVRKQTAISFAPKVEELCKKHPEMGPCQYERNVCRSAGGRIYAANGTEITMAHEAEYDKKVLRVRFKGG
ncbi:MAG: hypothetical protein ABI981_02410 [Betaproteobacteria bacterium]